VLLYLKIFQFLFYFDADKWYLYPVNITAEESANLENTISELKERVEQVKVPIAEVKELRQRIQEVRRPIKVKGVKVRFLYFDKPIPVGNKEMWIVRGDQLQSIVSENYGQRCNPDSYYLFSARSISARMELFLNTPRRADRYYREAYIGMRNLGIEHDALIELKQDDLGDWITIDTRENKLQDASPGRLIAAHKMLVGGFKRQTTVGADGTVYGGDIAKPLAVQMREEAAAAGEYNLRVERAIEKRIEKLNELWEERKREFADEARKGIKGPVKKLIINLEGEDLREYIRGLFIEDEVICDVDMWGGVESELASWNQEMPLVKELRKYTHDLCDRRKERRMHEGGSPKIMKRDDFLRIVKNADMEDLATCEILHKILAFNLEIRMDGSYHDFLGQLFDSMRAEEVEEQIEAAHTEANDADIRIDDAEFERIDDDTHIPSQEEREHSSAIAARIKLNLDMFAGLHPLPPVVLAADLGIGEAELVGQKSPKLRIGHPDAYTLTHGKSSLPNPFMNPRNFWGTLKQRGKFNRVSKQIQRAIVSS